MTTCGIENKPSAYSSLYLSNLLTCHTLKNEIFVKDSSTTMQPRMVEFDMQVDDDFLYHEIENQPFAYSSACICPIFFPSILLKNEIFCPKFLHNHAS